MGEEYQLDRPNIETKMPLNPELVSQSVIILREAVEKPGSLDEILERVKNALEKVREITHNERIGFVAGGIAVDGLEEEKIVTNLNNLHEYTHQVQALYDFFILSLPLLFPKPAQMHKVIVDRPWDFWIQVIKRGYITDFFRGYRFEEAYAQRRGAKKELDAAKEYLHDGRSINIY